MNKSMMTMLCVLVLASGLLVPQSHAVTYTGNLQYTPSFPADSGDGLYVQPSDLQWVNYTVSIAWTVTNDNPVNPLYPWKYTYTFGHNGTQAGISHVIIEASSNITENDIIDLTGAGNTTFGMQNVSSGSPGMPENMYGIRFHPLTSSPYTMTWSFLSNRQPVWGDFYARCGGKQGGINNAFNYNLTGSIENGFTVNDIDPTVPAANGSVDYHILRPDTVVPEPMTLGLILVGSLLLSKKRLE